MKKWIMLVLCLALLNSAFVVSAQDDVATPEPEATPEITPPPMQLDPLLGVGTNPPFDIELPEEWQLVLRDTYTYRDIVPDADGNLETLPIDVYLGPVSNGGTGWIVMLWGYDSLVPFSNELTQEEYDLRAAWINGLRMLQFVVFDARCNIGTSPQRDYTIGGLPATGAQFSAVECPFEQPDTRGWFSALSINNLNFAFFAYADPIQPAGSIVEFELQQIIDTVEFHVEDITVNAFDFQSTLEAIVSPTPGMQGPALPTATP